MVNSSEIRNLMGLAKKIVDKSTLRKIKKIKDKKEKKEVLEYSIKSELEMMHYDLVRKIRKIQREEKDVFSPEVKASLLNSKIKYFEINFYKKDFKNILSLYKEIKKELTNV
jgi:hypothetical protein